MTTKTGKKTISIPSEVTTPTRDTRRYSTGSTAPGSLASCSNTDEKILPRYLRASAGSCHDFCKYGRKLAPEEEGNQRILRRPPGNKPSINKEYRRPKVLCLGEKLKRPVIKAEPIIQSMADKEGHQVKSLNSDDSNKRSIIRSKALPSSKSSTENPNLALKDVPSKPRKFEGQTAAPLIKKATTSTAPKLVREKSLEKPTTSAKVKLVHQMSAEKHTTSSRTQITKQMASDYRRNIAPNKCVISSNKKMAISSRISSVQQSQEGKIETGVGMKEIKDKETIATQYAGDDILNTGPGKNRDGEYDSPVDCQEDIEKIVHESDCNGEKTLYVIEPELQKPVSHSMEQKSPNQQPLSPVKPVEVLNPALSDSSDSATENGTESIRGDPSTNDETNRWISIATMDQSPAPAVLDEPIGEECIRNQESSKGDCIGQLTTDNFHESSLPSSLDSEDFEESGSSVHESASEFGEENISNEDSIEVEGGPERTAPSSSFEDLVEESESKLSESIESASENGAAESIRNDELSKAKERRQKRAATLRPETITLTPHKLKFKRGKVIETPPDNSNGPRRLRFRRRRRPSFSQKGEVTGEFSVGDGQVGKRSYTRQNEMDSGISKDPKLEAPAVALRHQDTQDKKDPQGLLNSVIEETASKLVEVRKSKVKALVGAFETVISLKDGKPTPTTAFSSTASEEAH